MIILQEGLYFIMCETGGGEQAWVGINEELLYRPRSQNSGHAEDSLTFEGGLEHGLNEGVKEGHLF